MVGSTIGIYASSFPTTMKVPVLFSFDSDPVENHGTQPIATLTMENNVVSTSLFRFGGGSLRLLGTQGIHIQPGHITTLGPRVSDVVPPPRFSWRETSPFSVGSDRR